MQKAKSTQVKKDKPSETPDKVKWTEPQKQSVKRLENELERFTPARFKKTKDKSSIAMNEEDTFMSQFKMYETTGMQDPYVGFFLVQQAYNAQPEWAASWNRTSAMLHSVAPQDGLEGMLAVQMVSVHNMAMEFSRRAMVKDQNVEAVDRNINRASKLMRTFTAQIEALHKLRTKGQQVIQVQHQQIQVGNGGQAVIGNVTPGG